MGFKELWNEIKDIESYIQENKIKVIRVNKNSKIPLGNDYYNKPSKLEDLKKHDGNYGLIVGYNHEQGSSIAVIDIDGYSMSDVDEDKKAQIKQETAKLIYEALKDIPEALIVKTQSGGHHIMLWNKTVLDNIHDVSKNLHFPQDFPIQELAGASLKHSIEIFTKESTKQVVLPSSYLIDEETNEKKTYEVESKINNLADVGTVEDISQVVIDTLVAKGYTYKKDSKSNEKTKSSNKKHNKGNKLKLKGLSDDEINKVVELTIPIFKITDGAKHEVTLALGGFFSYHVSRESTAKIGQNIVKKIGTIFNDSNAFIDTLLTNYDKYEDKTGLPSLIKLIEDHDSDFDVDSFAEQLYYICTMEELGAVTIADNEVPINYYVKDKDKFLKYNGIFEGIDLILNITKNIGTFLYIETGKEVISFTFKYEYKQFKIPNLSDVTGFLKSKQVEVPKYFEIEIGTSLNNLDKSIFQTIKETKLEAEKEFEYYCRFGYKDKEYYTQNQTGITLIKESKKGCSYVNIANLIIKDITIVLDSLDILEPVYTVTYHNKTFNKDVTVKYLTKNQLVEEFKKANVFYENNTEKIETVISTYIISGTQAGRIETKTEAYLEGYFIVNNKVVSNTKLKNLKKPTPEEVAEAIRLLNEIMSTRSDEGKANDSTVYRFMLWNPFSYCLKQLGYGKAIYSLILTGKSQGNKSGATSIGRLFYLHTGEETAGSTVSVLGSKLEENSFVSAFDECSHLFTLKEALNVMKRAIYEKTARATKDRNDNKKIDEFQAIGLPMFLLNEPQEFKDYIINRYKITNYTSNSVISNKEKEKFNEKYLPEAPDTILNKLSVIGKVFSTKLIEIIEDPDERKRLFNIEELTIELLKEISSEAGEEFLPEMYEIEESSDLYNYDVNKEIRNILNTEFKNKNRLTGNRYYNSSNFTNSAINNDFDFIYYNKHKNKGSKKEFIINSKGLVDYINKNVEETVELEEILIALDLKEILEAKATEDGLSYSDFIKHQHKITLKDKGKKTKNITGFYLTTEEVANNLFSFDIEFSSDSDNNSDHEKHTQRVE